MGEIADMILEGEMCEACGAILDLDNPSGYADLCFHCSLDAAEFEASQSKEPMRKKTKKRKHTERS